MAWTGTTVTGPSTSTLYWDATEVGAPAVAADLFEAFMGVIPTGTTVTVPNSGDILDSASGDLVGTWSEGSAEVLTGTNTTGYLAGTGVRLRWNTAGIHNGRRVRGTTFLVPIAKGAFDTDGTVNTSVVTAGNAAIAAFLAEDIPWGVWSRPAPSSSDGEFSLITSGSLPDAVSWLRSRRT